MPLRRPERCATPERSERTVSEVWLNAARTVYGWAARQDPPLSQQSFRHSACVYSSGKYVWQGKDTASRQRVTDLLGEETPKTPGPKASSTAATHTTTTKVFSYMGTMLKPARSLSCYSVE
jgi:hypothetical protein